MRFIAMVKATPESESGRLPNKEELAEMGAFNEQLNKAGIMLDAEGLHSSAKGSRITFKGGKPSVVDGPFAETKELVAGFWMLQAKSKEEAVEWISRAPFKDAVVEIRQVFEAEDFGDAMTPEMRAREETLRTEARSR